MRAGIICYLGYMGCPCNFPQGLSLQTMNLEGFRAYRVVAALAVTSLRLWTDHICCVSQGSTYYRTSIRWTVLLPFCADSF